jgi:hypothetical protein
MPKKRRSRNDRLDRWIFVGCEDAAFPEKFNDVWENGFSWGFADSLVDRCISKTTYSR